MTLRRISSRACGRRLVMLTFALWAACGGGVEPQEFWRPWYERAKEDSVPTTPAADLGRPPDAGSRVDQGSPAGGCRLRVQVTTSAAGGRYAPRNIAAIWISEEGGRFVKTLAVWAEKRAKYLSQWNAATAAALQPGSRTDAISGATQSAHGVRSASWNCQDTTGMLRADGTYRVCFELTDRDGPGPLDCVAFSKGSLAWSTQPPDVPSFASRVLEFEP